MSAYTDAAVRFERLDGIRYRQRGRTSWEIGYKGADAILVGLPE